MSGSTGADRIQSREHFKKFLASYEKVVKQFPGFVSIKPSGSYNSNLSKQDFGDIDLITHIESNKDKATVKKELAAHLAKLPDSVIVPFKSERYKGKKFLNTGEIVTIRYHDEELGYSVQIDNIIALDRTEAGFKLNFLDLPAEKQGLILGLTKVATIETPVPTLFKKVGIKVPSKLPENEEYEFNLSSVEIQLRKVTYEPGSYKQLKREVVWKSRSFEDLKKILYQYDLDSSFEDLIKQAKAKLKNPRSSNRMKGVFTSMISVKSGEVGTQKGRDKEAAIKKVMDIFGESTMKSFADFLTESANPLKIRKVNKDWYQIDVEEDKHGIILRAVAIFKTEHNDWSVNDGEPKPGRKVDDLRRYVFSKLSLAKLFAHDLADAIKNDKPFPKRSNDKYI